MAYSDAVDKRSAFIRHSKPADFINDVVGDNSCGFIDNNNTLMLHLQRLTSHRKKTVLVPPGDLSIVILVNLVCYNIS